MSDKIVVIGGGYAGLGAIGVLQSLKDREITLIDPSAGHELIPELPEALRKHDPIDDHIVPFRDLLNDLRVSHIQQSAVNLSIDPPFVMLDNGEKVSFDWLVLSPGSVPSYPPIPGLKEIARPLRNAHDTKTIKDSLRYGRDQRIVVVGAGLTGVEVAGTLAEDHDVWLVEAAQRPLPALGVGLATYAERQLASAGVRLMFGQKLIEVTPNHLRLERDHLGYDVLIWAGGIAPPPWLRHTPLPLDERGYPKTDAHGQVLPNIFAVGDIWRVSVDGEDVPQTAQVATLAGAYVGDVISRKITGNSNIPEFRPKLRGMLISLDPGKGVGWVITGGLAVRGYGARTLKNFSFREYRQKLTRIFRMGNR